MARLIESLYHRSHQLVKLVKLVQKANERRKMLAEKSLNATVQMAVLPLLTFLLGAR